MKYPRLTELGIPIHEKPVAHVKWDDLRRVLKTLSNGDEFYRLFGIQTCSVAGPYPHDVEAVLERMMSGRLTGTQAFMD